MKKIYYGILAAIAILVCWQIAVFITGKTCPDADSKPMEREMSPITVVSPDQKKHHIWFDDFTGEKLNSDFWRIHTGGQGWGNNELQYYTDKAENCYIENGCLVIKAIKEKYQEYGYTSARISTKGKVKLSGGRIDIKARLVKVKGLFAAFWLLPVNDTYGNYKKNSEIDIMEMIGENPKKIYGVAHYSFNKKYKAYGKYTSKTMDYSQDFHLYSLEWTRERLTWLIDDKEYYSFNYMTEFSPDYQPFHQDFYLVINLAVGGDWPGFEIEDSALPAKMLIDYIKYDEQVE